MANINTNLTNNNGDNLYPVTFSNNVLMSNDNSKTLDDILHRTFSEITIASSDWNSGIYTTAYNYSNYAVYLDPGNNITKTQLLALSNAMLVGISNNGYCAFKCLGTTPVIDIPVKLEIAPLT